MKPNGSRNYSMMKQIRSLLGPTPRSRDTRKYYTNLTNLKWTLIELPTSKRLLRDIGLESRVWRGISIVVDQDIDTDILIRLHIGTATAILTATVPIDPDIESFASQVFTTALMANPLRLTLGKREKER